MNKKHIAVATLLCSAVIIGAGCSNETTQNTTVESDSSGTKIIIDSQPEAGIINLDEKTAEITGE